MAIFQLGSIVTSIVGSIGGTTFKRGASNLIVSKKSMGASRSLLLSNVRLGAISSVFMGWSSLSQSMRDDWAFIAPSYLFPDKFGVLRALTARQLFTKLSIQLIPVNQAVPDADQINNVLGVFGVNFFNLTKSPFKCELDISYTGDAGYLLVQIQVAQKNLYSPIFNRRQITAWVMIDSALGFDFTEEILKQFPYINEKYSVRAFVSIMNVSGFKSPAVVSEGVWLV